MDQVYETRVGDAFVIVGNDVLMRCNFPGFAADLLSVVGWLVAEDVETVEVSVGDKGNDVTYSMTATQNNNWMTNRPHRITLYTLPLSPP